MYLHGNRNKDRIWAIAGVVAVHGLLAYALLSGLAMRVSERASDSLKLVDIVLPLPPPPPPPPPEEASKPKGEPSPPNLKAVPSPVVAPAAEDPGAIASRRRAGAFDRKRDVGRRVERRRARHWRGRRRQWAGRRRFRRRRQPRATRSADSSYDSDYPDRRQARRDRGLGRGALHDPGPTGASAAARS